MVCEVTNGAMSDHGERVDGYLDDICVEMEAVMVLRTSMVPEKEFDDRICICFQSIWQLDPSGLHA